MKDMRSIAKKVNTEMKETRNEIEDATGGGSLD